MAQALRLISDEWREQNALLHEANCSYGVGGGGKHVGEVRNLLDQVGGESVLDYGCGKGTLREILGPIVRNYDPALAEFADDPEPADVVLCADVMEHVEPDCVDAVLQHIAELTKQVVLFAICCRPAKKTMPDGRNAHCNVQSREWWNSKLREHFLVTEQPAAEADEFKCLARRKA